MASLRFSFLLLLVLFFQACDESEYNVDISQVNYSLKIKRLDKDLFQGANSSGNWLRKINEKYGTFSPIYFEEIMRIGDPEVSMTANLAKRFTEDPTWSQLQNIIDQKYPNLDHQKAQLEVALKRFAVHFDDTNLPSVVAYNSGYNVGIYPSDQWLGIGLEWYCGEDHAIIKQLPPDLFPKYKLEKMNPDFLVPNALKGYLFYRFREGNTEENLLHTMVYNGKVLFIAAKLLQSDNYADVLNYSKGEISWCEENAYDIWKYLVENDLFFKDDPMLANKLMSDGPFTPGMPGESPGGAGNWVGLQMVHGFMKAHPNMGLADLMKFQNDRAFLEYYKFK